MSGKYRVWESLKSVDAPMSDILSNFNSTARRATTEWRLGLQPRVIPGPAGEGTKSVRLFDVVWG